MQSQTIKIDIRKVVEAKMPRYAKFIPKFVTNWLSRLVRQDEINQILSVHGYEKGLEFTDSLLKELDIKVNADSNRLPKDGRKYLFVCNHPLGGLDGIALMNMLGKHYDGKVRVIVNDILMQITPLAEMFLPINKHGVQSRNAVKDIDAAFDSDCQMLVFPAGLCSRKQDDGTIADLEWQKSFIKQSIEYQRDIIPLYFSGVNSQFFYRFARIRENLGLKLNIEMALLPGEMFKSRGSQYTIEIGNPIKWEKLNDGTNAKVLAQKIRQEVYKLKKIKR